ncbi:hypothetical protein WDU94_008203 [Cyamophila willieti]
MRRVRQLPDSLLRSISSDYEMEEEINKQSDTSNSSIIIEQRGIHDEFGPKDNENENQDIQDKSIVKLKSEEKSVNDGSTISDMEKTKENDQQEIKREPIRDTEQTKHVTYNEQVKIIETEPPDLDKQITFNDQEEIDNQDNKNNYGFAISDPNFKRKVTFSNEIIVIAYNYDDAEDQAAEDDCNESETIQNESKQKSGTISRAPGTKLDEITVNYADRVVNDRNIFKTVSFSNEVTVIHDGNLVFTNGSNECVKGKNKKHPSKVDKILSKLKKVVQKLEDKTHSQGGSRDQKVLGDAEQSKLSKTCNNQVQVVNVNMNQKHVAFSEHVESIDNRRNIEIREPNLRKVTFSNEIIVIAYPYENEDEMELEYEDKDYTAMLGDKELLDQTKYEEIEENSVNYAEKVVSTRNIFKTVSFSNEVTVIHDGNLVFRSDSTESVKDNFDVNKELECKECQG